MTYDIIIKDGTIVDGTGAPRFAADLALANGKIAAIGRITESAAEIIDARCLHDHIGRDRQASVRGEASGRGGAAVDALYLKADRMRFP